MVQVAELPKVSSVWLADVGRLLGTLANEDCCCFLHEPCPSCSARDLIERAPTIAYHAAISAEHCAGRPVETIETSVL